MGNRGEIARARACSGQTALAGPIGARQLQIGRLLSVTLLAGLAAVLGSGSAQALTPELLSRQAADTADAISLEWSRSVNGAGDIVNPLTGHVEGGYGRTMLAYGMLRADERRPGLNLLPIVRQAIPRSDAVAQAPFNLLALSETLIHADGALGPSATEALASSILSDPPFGTRAPHDPCFRRVGCYDNLKLVNATALLASLAALPGRSGPALTSFASRSAAERSALRLLTRTIPRVEIADAALVVGAERLQAATLSDPTTNPTAYLALSTMMLGRALQLYAEAPPRAALVSFRRAVVALLGLAGPDGAISYVGRGQGQVWTFASAAASCALAIRLLPGRSPIASRCEGLVETELQALAVRRSLGGFGIATVRRAGWVQGEGVDHYANATDYNGLCVYALNLAADALAGASDPGELLTPGAVDGESFGDPHGSGVATTDRNGLWFAVHRRNANGADSRWGFGLMAMERRTGASWTSELVPRPLGPGRQGPVLELHGRSYEPGGTRFALAPGRIALRGGWSNGRRLVRAATFAYEATARGVVLRVPVRKGDRLRLQDWALPGRQGTMSIPGDGVRLARTSPAAGDEQSAELNAFTYTITVKRAGLVRVLWHG
jgi:hypothetical protein